MLNVFFDILQVRYAIIIFFTFFK